MKKLMKIIPVVLVMCLVLTNVFAVTVPDSSTVQGGSASTQVTNAAKDIWATIANIVQILSIAAVVFAGVRYMFASADQKADIKKSMGVLAIGGILVFGATYVLQILGDVLK